MADQQQQQQQAMQQHQQQHNSQMSTNNVAAHSNNGMSNVPSTVSSPRTVPNSPLSAQQLTGQPIPQVQVIPQAMHNQGQYVQFMFAQNPALAMQSGVNFAMAQQRPPAAHSGVGPRSPAMMGVVPPSPGAQMAGMHLVAPPGSQQPIPLTSPTAKSPARTPSMSPSVANVTGQRVISAETFQQMQHQQQQQQMQQQQQQQHMQHQQHMQQQQQQQQHLQQQKFFIRPIASGMQLVGQQPMSSQGATLQVQSPVGTVAPTTQHQMMNPPQIISTQSLLGGQPIYGQFIPQNIPVAHQQYVSNQGQAVLTTQPMYVRPTLQNQPAVQNLGPVMAPKVGRPRLDQSQRKTPPGVSLAAKRQASGQARVTPIATRMIKSQTPPMNLSVSRQHMRHEAPKNVRARMKAPVHGATISGLVASRAANLVRVPNPNFVRSTQNQTSAENFPPSAETKTVFSEDCNGNGNRCNDMPKLFSTLPPSTPLGEGMVDGEKQRAVVKPQTLTHVIDGFVIEEGPLAFPVQASSLITDTADLPPKLSRVSSRESEEEVFKPNPAPVEEEPKLKCEFCGKVDKMIKFHRSKRFCSVACAKRYNVGSRHQGIKKAKAATPALGTLGTGFVRKKMMKRTWKRGQGGRLAVSRLPLMEHQADDEHSTTSSSSSSHHEQEDRSSSVSTPLESSQDAARNNPAKWTVQEVYSFVKSMGGCEPYAEAFKSQEIDGQALMLLKEDHLMSAMNMKLGPALKICARINTMKVETS